MPDPNQTRQCDPDLNQKGEKLFGQQFSNKKHPSEKLMALDSYFQEAILYCTLYSIDLSHSK